MPLPQCLCKFVLKVAHILTLEEAVSGTLAVAFIRKLSLVLIHDLLKPDASTEQCSDLASALK